MKNLNEKEKQINTNALTFDLFGGRLVFKDGHFFALAYGEVDGFAADGMRRY